MPFGTAVEIPSSAPLYAIGLLTDVVCELEVIDSAYCGVASQPRLGPTRERTLYVLVSLKRKKNKKEGELIPHHRFLNQLPRGRAFLRRRRRHNGPRCCIHSQENLHVLEWTYRIVPINKRAESS